MVWHVDQLPLVQEQFTIIPSAKRLIVWVRPFAQVPHLAIGRIVKPDARAVCIQQPMEMFLADLENGIIAKLF